MADDNELGPVYGRGQPGGHPLYRNKRGQVEETNPPDPPSDSGPQYDEFGGKRYKFTDITGQDPTHTVEFYSAEDPNAKLTDNAQGPVLGTPKNEMSRDLEILLGGTQDAGHISPKEYDQLTREASKGNKLAQQILVKGHYKAHDFPTLTQDLNKVEDPFVKALSNMPNVANAAEAQVQAITQPYDFSNAESQVNNILKNQGDAQLAQPNATTSAYVGKLDKIASGNPLTSSALGLPSIDQALAGLGPAAKVSEKAAPNAALLAALLSHLQYQDVYGTGLSSSATSQNPAWLQQLLAAVTGTTLGGGLPTPGLAAQGAGTLPSSTPGVTGSNA